MSRSEAMPTLTPELVTEILNKILEQLQAPDHARKLEEAREKAGNEMLKVMQSLFPIVVQVKMEVIKEFGFPESREGIIKFAQTLRSLERDDTEIARLHNLVQSYYLPLCVNTTNESPAEERTSSS